MRRGAFHFVEDTTQMRHDDKTQLFCGRGLEPAGLFERSDDAVERVVLAEKEDFVLSTEVVVEVCRREQSRGGNIAHVGWLRGKCAPRRELLAGRHGFPLLEVTRRLAGCQ